MTDGENSGTPAAPTSAPADAARRADLMPRLYDQRGRLIDFATYVQLHLDNPGCEHVASERVGPYWVSTLWFGIDSGSVPAPRQPGSRRAPAVYRTMVERLENRAPDPGVFGLTPDTMRYASEADARAGHAQVVETLRDAIQSATAERPAVRA
ncbi:hypothetical protein [Nocardioides sp. CER19]|uniref:hypothetical protein n=1 Tax=Nocardioides sp. CER19 TaxID=3038538 RepID=UPI00244A6A94|nr:hypothetical protein [Nocardioides sp. CER19]MDH2416264.1 hypothetical protein [Nocardioides sp. CER19]